MKVVGRLLTLVGIALGIPIATVAVIALIALGGVVSVVGLVAAVTGVAVLAAGAGSVLFFAGLPILIGARLRGQKGLKFDLDFSPPAVPKAELDAAIARKRAKRGTEEWAEGTP